jgi:hypothetical protein
MAFEPQDAIDFLDAVTQKESSNRADGLSDLRFRYGEQWNSQDMSARTLSGRPCLTINEVDAYCRQVTNNQRQQRPRIKAHPVNSLADPKIAEVLTGLTRHIEVNSDADNAYDLAFEFVVSMGWGYWRVLTDYVREDSFDQDIMIAQIENPFSVYFDPNSSLPDGSDAEKCLITDNITKAEFKRRYPSAQDSGFTATATGDNTADWMTKDDIRIAEYFEVERKKSKLVMLSDRTVTWADKLPSVDVLRQAGIEIIGDRESYRREVMWYKTSAFEVLDKKPWAGRWIPIVPCYGDQFTIDGKKRRAGLVRNARDPQIMLNYWNTAATESIAMAPKAKWLMAEGQDEDHEREWASANISASPVLRYKPSDIEGRPMPAPQRIQPEPPPTGILEMVSGASHNLQKVMGMFDPATRLGGPTSGKALQGERGQSEMSNFHYYDNLTRSIKHTGRIILDLVPKIYDSARVVRIIGDDGKPSLTQINTPQPQQPGQPGQPQPSDTDQAVTKIMNDVTVGEYDVVMDTGPGFNTKRMEALDSFQSLMAGPLGEEIAKVGPDLIVRLYDAPGMDALADRLAASNPMAQIDEQSDIPPQAQVMIKGLQQQLQQAQQQMQAMDQEIKTKQGIEKMRQDGETQREHMRTTIKAHDVETRANVEMKREQMEQASWRHDVETKAQTALSVAEIKAIADLLSHHMKSQQVERVADQEETELRQKSNETEPL